MSLEFFLVQNFWKCDNIFLKNLPHFEKVLYSTTEHTNPLNAKQSCNRRRKSCPKTTFLCHSAYYVYKKTSAVDKFLIQFFSDPETERTKLFLSQILFH